MLADYAYFPRWNRDNIENLIIYDGFENYARAQSQGNERDHTKALGEAILAVGQVNPPPVAVLGEFGRLLMPRLVNDLGHRVAVPGVVNCRCEEIFPG